MIKVLIASGVAVSAAALASPALAGPYVNPEFNGSTFGDDYLGGVLTLDVGYEGGSGAYSYYLQGDLHGSCQTAKTTNRTGRLLEAQFRFHKTPASMAS